MLQTINYVTINGLKEGCVIPVDKYAAVYVE